MSPLELFGIIHYNSSMTNALDTLIHTIPDHPAIRIMHIVDTPTDVLERLSALVGERHYELDLLLFDAQELARLKVHYGQNPRITVRSISLDQARYHRQAKLYDYVFVDAMIADPDLFVKRLYPAMKNGANIFLLLPPPSHAVVESWRKALEAHFYVAFSAFELSESYHVISAKKMHGWGG